MQHGDHNTVSRIPLRESLSTLAGTRLDSDVVVTNMGASRVWPLIENHRLDFHFNPSTMGGVIPLAMGIALARPQRRVIVVSGDGSLLMSLGSLVSVTAAGCSNLSVILLDNGIYDVTGGQKTAAADAGVRFDMMARSVGFESVSTFDDADSWQNAAAGFLSEKGPGFCWLKVAPALSEDMMTQQEPMNKQIERLRTELEQ
ncbi:MAG: thiamine pyrophosphate-dependent enzyme [Fuerstiella sp.]|nr:thiamine pyrophosphate-dependent enzyme [Fuerstiella sp.]